MESEALYGFVRNELCEKRTEDKETQEYVTKNTPNQEQAEKYFSK